MIDIIAGFSALDIKISKTSGEESTLCPACSHTRKKTTQKCLHVDLDRGLYYCRNCGWSGRVPGVVGGYGSAPTTKTYRRPDPASVAVQLLRAGAVAWLEARGITREVWESAGITSARVWMPIVEREVWTIAFPYRRGGELVNVKYRDRDKNFKMEKGAERCLYGLDDVIDRQELVWVEGEIDKLSCAVAGYLSCVSIPNGAPPATAKNLAGHYEPIDTAHETIAKASRHIIAVDNDDPGRGLRDELIRRLGAENCRIAIWPDGCKDANDVLVRFGSQTLADCLHHAIDVPIAGSFSPDDLADDLADYYERGAQPGIAAGTPQIARYYKPFLGKFTIVNGIPGMGKTTWLDWYVHCLMVEHGMRFAICSPENQPIHRHLAKLCRLHVGKPFHDGPSERMTAAEREEARSWLAERVRFICPHEDDRGGYSLANILDLCRAEIQRFGVNGIVIDPWNELEHRYPPGMREDQYIAQSLITLRTFARKHNVHIWLVAHPRQMPRAKDGSRPLPDLGDLSGGQMFWNKCDFGICIHRSDPMKIGPSELHIQKVKEQPEGGIPGAVRLLFDPLSGRFRDDPEPAKRRGAAPSEDWQS